MMRVAAAVQPRYAAAKVDEEAAMLGFLIRALVSALGLWVASKVLSGLKVDSTETLLLAALLLGIVNAFVRPILVFLTFPVTIITLGLFLLVINGLMIELVSFFLHGFKVEGFGTAVLAAIITGVVSWVASWFIGPSGRWEAYRR
jgi:putative membrane protein